MRYWQASVSDVSGLSINALGRKVKTFQNIHKGRLKFDASIAGATLK